MPVIAARAERTYLAGLGASGALIAAAAVAGLFLIALVAFKSWPSGGTEEVTAVRTAEAPAPSRAASVALAPAAGATAITPTPVILARAGDPDSVVAPGANPQPGGGVPGGGAPQAPGAGGPATGPGGIAGLLGEPLTALDPLTAPVIGAVGATIEGVGGTTDMFLGPSATASPGTVYGLGPTVGQLGPGVLPANSP